MPAPSTTASARTTVVSPADPTLRSAIRLALVFAALKLLLHIAGTLYSQHLGYSYFRDEFYYLICGRRLAWGYVDHGPLVAVQARLSTLLFGTSILGIRMLSALAGAIAVFLTGILAWALGGARSAQSLAMLALLVTPEYLGIDSFLSMNSVEPVFWMFCTLAVIRILSGASPRSWWTLFGISAGLGLLNKPSMTFFLVALLVGLLLTPQRSVLFTRWSALAIALLVLIALPDVLWQLHNHWPTLEFLRNGKLQHKNVELPLLPFLGAQIQMMHPVNALLWIAGLVSLLRARSIPHMRWIAITYLVFFAITFRLHAKDYYLAPIYPVLFAAGAIAWQHRIAASERRRNSAFAFPIYQTLLVITGLIILPMSIPVLRPSTWIAYTSALHLQSGQNENARTGPLPQFYADRFGWPQYLALVNKAFLSLSPEDRARVTLFADNYGEAGALDFLGARQHLGLPPAISGHNSYWLWGPHGSTMDLVIAISGGTPEELREKYESVTVIGSMEDPLAMPHEHKNVYLLRGRRPDAPFLWSKVKNYI